MWQYGGAGGDDAAVGGGLMDCGWDVGCGSDAVGICCIAAVGLIDCDEAVVGPIDCGDCGEAGPGSVAA